MRDGLSPTLTRFTQPASYAEAVTQMLVGEIAVSCMTHAGVRVEMGGSAPRAAPAERKWPMQTRPAPLP